MFDGRRDDLEVLAVVFGRAANRRVVGFRRTGGEDDLVRLGVEESGDLLARAVDELRDLAAEGVHRARVAVEFVEEGEHDVTDFGGDPSRGVVVEIDCAHHLGRIIPQVTARGTDDGVRVRPSGR